MIVADLSLPGLKLIKPKVFHDPRGFFFESFRKEYFEKEGIQCPFVQDNVAYSCKDTLRGMHFQSTPGQDKLVYVLQGRIFDVAVDIRPSSPTFGKWQGVILDDAEREQLFVPIGFAHGYCVLSETALVIYKVSNVYNPATECGFKFDDPMIGIEWPVKNPLLSERDKANPTFSELFMEVMP